MNEISRLIHASKFAFEGLAYLLREEKNTRLLLAVTVLALIICPVLGFTAFQTIIIFFTIMVTLVAEVINTAIEIALDLEVKGQFHPKVKIAKDVAACSVLLCVINSAAVFLVILVSNLLKS